MLARSYVESDVSHSTESTFSDSYRDQPVFPHQTDAIPPGVMDAGAYQLRFAWSRSDLHAAQSLRHQVFQQELGEGLAHSTTGDVGSSAPLGLDSDGRDEWFHHLLITHRESGAVVGTYRLQTAVMAASRHGFYSASLFELGAMPGIILEKSVEVGRACVAPAHRSGRVLRLLWRGLARYMQWNEKRYLFGCCSLPGTAPETARSAWRILHAREMVHDRILVRPRPDTRALPDDGRFRPLTTVDALNAPLTPLFDGYLALGARVCGAPAVDREFGTTDFLVLLDVHELDARTYRSFFG